VADEEDKDVAQYVFPTLQKSGFPFQTTIVDIVRNNGRWHVDDEEIPWRDDGGRDHFLDFAATNRHCIITVECKKTEKDIYTFLLPHLQKRTTEDPVTRSPRCDFLIRINDSTQRLEMQCGDWRLLPRTPESAFCVVANTDANRRMLEADVQLLLRGTDAYGYRRKRAEKPGPRERPGAPLVPVLVTNAKLFVARIQPNAVWLETGQVQDHTAAEVRPIDVIRFRKAFVSHRTRDLGERTVLVVRATALEKLLCDLEVDVQEDGPIGPIANMSDP